MLQLHSPRRRAFTLVELLVVIGIIAILISILMPALSKAKDSANATKCQASLRQLMTACIMFAQDNKDFLPGNSEDQNTKYPQPEFWKRDMFFGPAIGSTVNLKNVPQQGTLWKYIRNKDLILCPSMESSQSLALGDGTNERFDYGAFLGFAGAKLSKIKTTSFFTHPGTGITTTVPTPYLCQEQASLINGTNIEAGHSNEDAMSIVHGRGSYYASTDGSVHYFQEGLYGTKTGIRADYNGPRLATRWTSVCPLTGRLKHIGRSDTRFGNWNSVPQGGVPPHGGAAWY